MEILDSDLSQALDGDFEFYRDFINAGQVEDFVKTLEEHHIPYRLEKGQTLLDGAITGHGFLPFAVVKLRTQDFKKINAILEQQALADPHFVEMHYLQQFDAKELFDVVKKPDEWTPVDVAVARQILERRGIAIPSEDAELFKKERNEMLRAGKKGQTFWMATYSVFVLAGGFLFSPLFLIAGIGMGWFYWQDKTIDTDGQKFFTFEPKTRQAGQVIFYLGWASLAAGFAWIYWMAGAF